MQRRGLCALLLTFAAPIPAAAKAQSDYAYRLEDVFSTATRFVRVDRGCRLVDKDAEAAFVVFECPIDEKKVSRGSLELIRTTVNGQEGVRLAILLPDEGHGVELRWMELLERKLRDERGSPREAPRPKPGPPVAPPSGAPPSDVHEPKIPSF